MPGIFLHKQYLLKEKNGLVDWHGLGHSELVGLSGVAVSPHALSVIVGDSWGSSQLANPCLVSIAQMWTIWDSVISCSFFSNRVAAFFCIKPSALPQRNAAIWTSPPNQSRAHLRVGMRSL